MIRPGEHGKSNISTKKTIGKRMIELLKKSSCGRKKRWALVKETCKI